MVLSISILVQKCQICSKGKKKLHFGRNVDFFIKCALLLKVIMFLQKCLFLEECDFLCEGFYTLTKCQILIKKNFNFLGYVNLYMCYFSLKYFICWKIVILIQNMILCNDILGRRVIFLAKSTLHLV